jgi:transcriptional regulator with XRE-family HTH domain
MYDRKNPDRRGAMAQTLDRAVEAEEIVVALRGYGFTQNDVARAVGVSDRAVRNWSQEGSLRRRNEERLHELRRIVLLLDDSLSHRGVGQWFRAHNRLLEGRRPLDVLAEGDADAVRRAAAAFADGAYA